jgi:hypothetical protein
MDPIGTVGAAATGGICDLEKLRQAPQAMLKVAIAARDKWQSSALPWQVEKTGVRLDLGAAPAGAAYQMEAWVYGGDIFVRGKDAAGKAQWAKLASNEFQAAMEIQLPPSLV